MSRIELNLPDGRELFIRVPEEVEPAQIYPRLKKIEEYNLNSRLNTQSIQIRPYKNELIRYRWLPRALADNS